MNDETPDTRRCPECAGTGIYLGTMGEANCYRCRHCGIDFSVRDLVMVELSLLPDPDVEEEQGTEESYGEAALCAWECLLEWMQVPGRRPDFESIWQVSGTAAMRSFCWDIRKEIDKAYRQADYSEAFDWEFVPRFMDMCIDWTGRTPLLKEDYLAIAHEFEEAWRDL